MPRKPAQAAQKPPQEHADPLADLRDLDDEPGAPGPVQGDEATDTLTEGAVDFRDRLAAHADNLADAATMVAINADVDLQDRVDGFLAYLADGRLFVQEHDQDEAIAQTVVAWHADTTALRFVHKGDACGCRYLAGLAVRTILPAALEADEDPAEED